MSLLSCSDCFISILSFHFNFSPDFRRRRSPLYILWRPYRPYLQPSTRNPQLSSLHNKAVSKGRKYFARFRELTICSWHMFKASDILCDIFIALFRNPKDIFVEMRHYVVGCQREHNNLFNLYPTFRVLLGS